jgi:NAD(P)-dependent dehydrogenase (short-subunit alcohol dehydrogenase family)
VLHFSGRVVWITGAGSGLGRAMAEEFARQGADVAVSGRRVERLAATAAAVERLARRALIVPCDVRDGDAVRAAVARVAEWQGHVDVAVANAGFGVVGRIAELSVDDWRRQFDTNVFGVLTVIQHALPELRKTRGRLALVGSVAGVLPSPGTGPYSASKFALRAIGMTLAMELAGSGVTCTTLQPGFVESDIARVDNDGHFDAAREDPRPRRLMWSADAAARVMVRAIRRRKREATFTVHGRIGAFLGMHAPGLVCWLLRDRRRVR